MSDIKRYDTGYHEINEGSIIAAGDSRILVSGSAHVEAWESAHVEARGSAHVAAWGSAHVVAWESAHVEAWESAHVEARESAHVEARGSAHVVARGSAHVEAWESAHVVAWESAHVEARDYTSIIKYGNSKIKLISNKAIIINPKYPSNIDDWCALKGIRIVKGYGYFYKAVKYNGTDFYTGKINYITRKEIICPDWNESFTGECGPGLHLADSESGLLEFIPKNVKYKILLVRAKLSDCRCFGGHPQYPQKIRAKACKFVKVIREG